MLTATLLSRLYTHYRSSFPDQTAFLYSLLSSYYSTPDRVLSPAGASYLLSGTRRPPKKILRHYRDFSSPACPCQLLADAVALIESLPLESQRRTLVPLLMSYLDTLPPCDQTALIESHITDPTSSTATTADLLTRVLWHALCYDTAEQ